MSPEGESETEELARITQRVARHHMDGGALEDVVAAPLVSLPEEFSGSVGYSRSARSYLAEVGAEGDDGYVVLLSVGRSGIGAVPTFARVVRALPMVDWSQEGAALAVVAEAAGVSIEELRASN